MYFTIDNHIWPAKNMKNGLILAMWKNRVTIKGRMHNDGWKRIGHKN